MSGTAKLQSRVKDKELTFFFLFFFFFFDGDDGDDALSMSAKSSTVSGAESSALVDISAVTEATSFGHRLMVTIRVFLVSAAALLLLLPSSGFSLV